MPSTIKDVAKLSGVSIGTVDRVLHERGRVSAKTREAVLTAVKELDYRPSQVARALVSNKNPLTLGITYPMVDRDFWQEAEIGIKAACSRLEVLGVRILVHPSPTYNIKDQTAAIDALVEQNVDGIILTAVDNSFSQKIDRHIPTEIPYATVINDTTSGRRLFFLGPDDFSLGRLMAKLVQLYLPAGCDLSILAPNMSFSGTQQRISGFLSKINQNSLNIHVQRVFPIEADSTEASIQKNVHDAVKACLKDYSDLNALYITNGLIEYAAEALEKICPAGKVLLFGHEHSKNLERYIKAGTVAASIYQKPAQEWYQAINMLYEYLIHSRSALKPVYYSECSIIIKETLPFIKVGELDSLY